MGDRVAHPRVAHLLDRRREDADLARAQFLDIHHLRFQDGKLVDPVAGAGLHHLDVVALADHPVDHPDHHDHAQIGVVPRIHQHRLQRRVPVALGRGQARDDRLQHIRNTKARLGADLHRVRGVDPDHVLDLLRHPDHIGRGQVDLVQNRHDLVARIDRLIDIGQRLCLDPLRRVDDQKRSLDRLHRAAHLIGEIHMPGRVDQVQDIGLAILRRILDPHGVGLDRDAPLALDIHRVEHLFLHVPFRHGPGQLDQPVGQGGFPVVDMRHDREIADMCKVGHGEDM